MRRIIAFLIITAMLFSFPAFAATDETKVTVDGKQLQFDVPPAVVQGRTLVPLRAIFEALGATLDWDNPTKTVTGTKGSTTIVLTIGNKTATINGAKKDLDVPGTIINSRTLVPARFIAEALGAKVDWDAATKTVVIKSGAAATTYKVLRVVDGDTLEIEYNGAKEKVRLIGVDTPESVHPDAAKNNEFGEIASIFTKGLLEGKEIELEFDVQERDKYGRLLAYVWINGKMYNKTLLEEGYAKVATFPPNVKYVEDFKALQTVARDGNKGLWAYEEKATEPTAPSQSTQPTAPSTSETGNVLKVKAGENATASIQGTPGKEYTISVYYSSGASKASGLEPKKADANGNVSWTWKVGPSTKPGQYKVVIEGDKKIELTLEVE
ncbi:Endonuclease YncB, thermonuclease family [Geosporobacter subterraneus DSM 17957]|uniref:Endonuclease YncB, thermonuclease family n=1 Tax=Geosporobacter subterraneus DSM 17957 TaxID=1121919 RepID=A0A1M6DMU7_9FIRM|nr:stalk domain-containing protein [Geosporobacter subterraneus]SHI74505.1 Endonuclease YncB, thermonuclease family [Geosporobacter subterraneus DSM 17957]